MVRRVLARWMRYDVIALDQVGYVPLAEIGAPAGQDRALVDLRSR